MNELVIILFLITLAILISVIKYIVSEKKEKETTYSEILINMIKSLFYKKSVLNNDYPEYHGELEKKDVEEYIAYLKTGVSNNINGKA